MTDQLKALWSFIDASADIAIDLQRELCKHPALSPANGGEGELDKAEFLSLWLRAQGIENIERFDCPCEGAKEGIRPSLVATIPGEDEAPGAPRLWIMSHLDVVPPGELSLWKSDPWVLEVQEGPQGKMIVGRGVEDNQQAITASCLAALALVKQGVRPSRTLKLLFAADEENGSVYGLQWLIKTYPDLFQKNDLVLIPDSGDPEGRAIEIAEKNHLWIKCITRGRQAHAAMPDKGTNAYVAGADLTVQLYYGLAQKFSETDPLFDPDCSTFQPTKKEPNVPNINTIPGEDVFYVDMRILPRHPVDDVIKEVERIKTEVEVKHGVLITCEVGMRNESPPTSPDSALVTELARHVEEVYGVKTRPVGIGGGTFAAFLRKEGIDCAVWARIEGSAHQPNEYGLVRNILGDAKVMASLALGKE
ncbi:MAG: M20 family metallo-hydrolase [Treponema sp.]|nr:M20 family metallo-hydrolase [Treponema sp.]